MTQQDKLLSDIEKKSLTTKPKKTLFDLVLESKPQVELLDTIPNVDRFLRVCVTMLKLNTTLAQCDPFTILGAIMTAAEYGLEPNTLTGECSIIPRGRQAVFQMGYQGWITLSEHVLEDGDMLAAYEVYEGDTYKVSLGLNPDIVHERASMKERGEITGYYAYIRMKNGTFHHIEMSVDDFIEMVSRSPSIFQSKAWRSPRTIEFNEKAKGHLMSKVLKYYRGKMRKYAMIENKARHFNPELPQNENVEIDVTDYEEIEALDTATQTLEETATAEIIDVAV